MSIAPASGVLLTAPASEARDDCGPGFQRGFRGWCRPNLTPTRPALGKLKVALVFPVSDRR
ncbi:GCG_CRPN prefix-to-repeats domain-containing protein [Methylobacterium sp. EM32]|uniref:GCG_CRPN prefix-to-repeats domain-containing protein n=1 Tax=Methylobacterium sp. EM32 TaxID=3163481 RepID=UPI0038B2AF43